MLNSNLDLHLGAKRPQKVVAVADVVVVVVVVLVGSIFDSSGSIATTRQPIKR